MKSIKTALGATIWSAGLLVTLSNLAQWHAG